MWLKTVMALIDKPHIKEFIYQLAKKHCFTFDVEHTVQLTKNLVLVQQVFHCF